MTSSIQMSMMNSHSAGTLFEPVFGRRMPSYSEKMAPARLSQPQCPPGFMGKQYDGAYFSYKAQGKDITAFPAPWSSTESSVVDRRSPMTHLSGIDRLHIYRKDSSSEENHSAHKNSPTKQGFTFYTKSPILSSPQSSTSVIVRNEQAAGDRVSTDRPVYLTVPPAVYRHGPCCTDFCCVMGHGSPSLSNQVYEHSWKTGEPGDTQQQQRQLHTEGVSLCSPGQTRTVPAVLDQTYSPTKAKEVSHGLQCSPRAYPSLYPSQATYEPVIYHNRSPISKYGQAPQHPAYYYSPTNAAVEKRTESKNTGSKHTQEIPVVLKHPLHPPGDHYMATASLPRFEAMPNPAFLPEFDYSGYFVPTLNLNTSPMHTHLTHPHAVHSDYINTSPKHVHRPIATLPSVHRDKSSQLAEHSSPFARVEQTSPTTCQRKSAVPTSSPQSHNSFCPPKHSLHLRPPAVRIPGAPPPLVAPAHLGLNIRPSRHHAYHFQPYFRHPHMSPTRTILSNKTNNQRILYCPPIPVSMENVTNPQPSYINKGPLKRALSSSPFTNEDDDVFVVETNQKRQRTEHGNTDHKNKELSPPMPVINNVFSLAPYQTYIQLARLRLGALPPRPVHYSLEQAQAQLSNEDVRLQTAVFKDTVTESASVKEVLNTNRAKHLDRCTEPAGQSKDYNSDPPTVNVTIKQEKNESLGQQARSNCIQPTTLPAEVKLKQEGPDEPLNTCAAVSKAAPLDLPKERPNEEDAETKISKKEQDNPTDQNGYSELSEYPEQLKIIKKEPEEIDPPDNGHMFEIKKCEPDFEYNVERRAGSECGQKLFQREVTPALSPPPAFSAPPHPGSKVNFLNIPPQCLKLSSYNIILPEVNLPRGVHISANKSPVPPPTQPTMPSIPLQMPVRKHFFELHQSLVKLISKSVAATSEETLKSWLSQMELNHIASGKNQQVSCLFGRKGREACLNEEMKSSLEQVAQRLNEYAAQERCPFPFVVRTGAIFLPMLVVKEVLFPSVHGALIDQVLQVHRVELRPTTLSEEKTLIQMHKRACSSRLRRLMSLKHLPDVYADVVNLLYYTSVCKQLGIELDDSFDADESCEGPSSSSSNSSSNSPPAPTPSPHEDTEQPQPKSLSRTSRIKRSCRRLFLGCSSDEEQQTSSQSDSAPQPSQKDDGSIENDNSWMCPLATEGDAQRETSDTQCDIEPSAARTFQGKSKSGPGVILKLRRTCNSKRMSYRPVLDSERSQPETQPPPDTESSRQSRKTPEIAKWKRTSGLFSNSLRPLNAYSKRNLRSLLATKYFPYLRSAVRRARRAVKVCYPDLVGKRIQHLYEEDDKSEVWYRGEVLGVHKAHPNPLKTVFEVRYDSEPEWKYYLELLIDYKKGWLKIDE